ncbi:hypothetical protein F4813DRAFT_389862 [Daldinia decipiens]|uniref:uncharacterized protein n=1 Tax=Daldinia decipiens TaxID=326647 RepID=UPI0020C351F6|nr:uncharacterized protein F4813DRAFT_389862 [Daldinia decipiens]KAI1657275.1 hypothetical protein F4813DRAFT_389862 [Daldinia decipiens]
MSSSKPISISIQPLNYADIPACARITSSAFSVDLHTIVKKTYIYAKAVDDEMGEIVGHAGWASRNLDPALVPWSGPGDTKPAGRSESNGKRGMTKREKICGRE